MLPVICCNPCLFLFLNPRKIEASIILRLVKFRFVLGGPRQKQTKYKSESLILIFAILNAHTCICKAFYWMMFYEKIRLLRTDFCQWKEYLRPLSPKSKFDNYKRLDLRQKTPDQWNWCHHMTGLCQNVGSDLSLQQRWHQEKLTSNKDSSCHQLQQYVSY